MDAQNCLWNMDKKPVLKVTAFGTHILTGNYVHPHTDQCRLIRRYTGPCTLEIKLGCVVRMVVDSILPHAKSGPNDHRKDAPLFIFELQIIRISNALNLRQQM